MSEHRDPAEITRERRERIEDWIRRADSSENDAAGYEEAGDEEAESLALTFATNLRLRALCEHQGLRLPEGD